ncbi:hypothetical protein GCM10022207_30640 [Streptomyces lannensis]|uniref:Uncharacterized protein n=1 Tax=Streptomyces lannensis TaxID=766498 RepID=A0ABP7K361_9ACTN
MAGSQRIHNGGAGTDRSVSLHCSVPRPPAVLRSRRLTTGSAEGAPTPSELSADPLGPRQGGPAPDRGPGGSVHSACAQELLAGLDQDNRTSTGRQSPDHCSDKGISGSSR